MTTATENTEAKMISEMTPSRFERLLNRANTTEDAALTQARRAYLYAESRYQRSLERATHWNGSLGTAAARDEDHHEMRIAYLEYAALRDA